MHAWFQAVQAAQAVEWPSGDMAWLQAWPCRECAVWEGALRPSGWGLKVRVRAKVQKCGAMCGEMFLHAQATRAVHHLHHLNEGSAQISTDHMRRSDAAQC